MESPQSDAENDTKSPGGIMVDWGIVNFSESGLSLRKYPEISADSAD